MLGQRQHGSFESTRWNLSMTLIKGEGKSEEELSAKNCNIFSKEA